MKVNKRSASAVLFTGFLPPTERNRNDRDVISLSALSIELSQTPLFLLLLHRLPSVATLLYYSAHSSGNRVKRSCLRCVGTWENDDDDDGDVAGAGGGYGGSKIGGR